MPPIRKCVHNNSARFPSDCGCWDHTPNEKTVEEKWIEDLQVFKFNREKENGYRMTHEDYIEFIKTLQQSALEEKKELVKSTIDSIEAYYDEAPVDELVLKIKALAERHNININ